MSEIAVKERDEALVEERVNENMDIKIETEMEIYKLSVGQKIYVGIRSALERLLAALAIVILSPILLILALLVKCTSKGPVFFKQERIGKNRKIFKCYKFRSMTQDAPHYESDKTFNAQSCVTKVGKFMRKTSLDELAQLFNVVTGKMSIIGYRPLIAKETEIDLMRLKKGVYQIKPGITGWAQINGRTEITDEQKADYDEYYLRHISLWMDIKICFKTLRKMINKVGHKDKKEGEK